MDGKDSLYVVARHFRKVHRLNLAVMFLISLINVIQSLLFSDFESVKNYSLFGSAIMILCGAIYFLPLKRIMKAFLIVLVPAVANMVAIFLYQYTTDRHYTVFLIIAMAALYLDKRIIVPICIFLDACFVALFVFYPDRVFSGPGGVLYHFIRLMILVNAAAILVYTVTRWSRGILKKLMQSNAHLVKANRTLVSSEEKLRVSVESLSESEERFRMIFEEMSDGVMLVETDGTIVGCNRAWQEIYGLRDNEVIGRRIWDVFINLVSPEQRDDGSLAYIRKLFCSFVDVDGDIPGEFEIHRQDGKVRTISLKVFAIKTREGKRIGIITDDLSERKEHEKRIHDLAYRDAVTGLPNRTVFLDELGARLSVDSTCSGALYILNLDRLKAINDIFGHSFGDTLLSEVSDILLRESPDAFVARLSGGEFAMISDGTKTREESVRRAASIIQALDRPFEVEGNKIHLAANIGIALFPEAGSTVAEVMKNADAALHKAREMGRNRFLVFDRAITEAFKEYVTVENGLHTALGGSEFRLYYQPQVDCSTGHICGFEALLRWERPEGIIPPNRFIKIAEDSGLIVPIGMWVIDEACRFARDIEERGGAGISISLNISTLQLVQSDFTEKVNNIVDASGVKRSSIGFEITESAFMQSFETNVEKLEVLKKSGIGIHLDDFGTGYSSLSYLKRLPIDVVKIDKSFVDDVAAGEGKKDLTGPIVRLAHTIGLKVIAEGVETENQLRELSRYDCDMVQGYLISRPIPANEVDGFLAVYSPFIM